MNLNSGHLNTLKEIKENSRHNKLAYFYCAWRSPSDDIHYQVKDENVGKVGEIKSLLKNLKIENITKSTCVQVCRGISFVLLSGVAAFWISEVLGTYFAYPVNTAVTMVKNESFRLPSITICPFSSIAQKIPCYDKTKLNKYNLTEQTIQRPNYWEILSKIKYSRQEDCITDCTYVHTDYRDSQISNCTNTTTVLGSWKTYETQDSTCHTFTPIPAVSVIDYVQLFFKHDKCKFLQATIHSPDEVYQSETNFDFTTLTFIPGRSYSLDVAMEEHQKVNRKTSPCEEDPTYSESTCTNSKKIEYLVKQAGCKVPEAPGIFTFEDYPECDVLSSDQFKRELSKLNSQLLKYPQELQNEIQKCLQNCNKFIYKYNENFMFRSHLRPISMSILSINMDADAIPYMRVKEQLALSPEMLVSFIGGTIGIFLGYSCLSVVDFIEFLWKKVMKTE